MAQITLKDGEHVERALRRFKKVVEAAGIIKDVRRREFYLKPSIRKKQKIAAAAKRRRRTAQRTTF